MYSSRTCESENLEIATNHNLATMKPMEHLGCKTCCLEGSFFSQLTSTLSMASKTKQLAMSVDTSTLIAEMLRELEHVF